MVLSITAFLTRIYLRSLTFKKFMFFIFLKVLEVIELHLCETLLEL